MTNEVARHYGGDGKLSDAIAQRLQRAGMSLDELKTVDLAPVDEFHIRGRKATMELAAQMKLQPDSRVLDIGSGLGGPARTIAEEYGCQVTGIDLTEAFCEAAQVMSGWVRLGDRCAFQQGDATALPFESRQFGSALTVHVAMNIPDKDKMYQEARRVLKPGGIFAIYDVLQGEGGDVLFPVPWARESSISHLASPEEMDSLLNDAGFKVLDVQDSSDESHDWFTAMRARIAESVTPAVTFQAFLGDDFPQMVSNQVRNLAERRIRTVSFICEA